MHRGQPVNYSLLLSSFSQFHSNPIETVVTMPYLLQLILTH